MKYSASRYPTEARSNDVLMIDGVPGPVTGPSTAGTGTVEGASVGGDPAAAADHVAVPATAMTTATTVVPTTVNLFATAHHRPGPGLATAGGRRERPGERPRVWHAGGRRSAAYDAGAVTWATTKPPWFSPLTLVLVSV
jgi:hypothetical protein